MPMIGRAMLRSHCRKGARKIGFAAAESKARQDAEPP
jgi:hypothetical protein